MVRGPALTTRVHESTVLPLLTAASRLEGVTHPVALLVARLGIPRVTLLAPAVVSPALLRFTKGISERVLKPESQRNRVLRRHPTQREIITHLRVEIIHINPGKLYCQR